MPYLHVYSPKDFIKGLPDEAGAAAEGGGPWELTLAEDARPTLVEIKDDDGVLDEVDYSQALAAGLKIDGAGYEAGTSIHSAYDLINSDSGHQVTSLHFGGTDDEQGVVHGLVSTMPLKPGKPASSKFLRLFPGFHHKAESWPAASSCLRAGGGRLLA